MFRLSVSNTPFTSAAAERIFERIRAESFDGDQSFASTLRAVVFPRLPADETINLRFGSLSFSDGDVSSGSRRLLSRPFDGIANDGIPIDGYIRVYSLTADAQSNEAYLNYLHEKFCQTYEGFVELENIYSFFQRAFKARCFVNPEHRTVLILVSQMDFRKLHLLQCAIPAILQWYFPKESKLDEAEMNLMKSLQGSDRQAYLDCLDVLAARWDFRTEGIRQMLGDFESRYERSRLESVENEIANADSEVDRLSRSIGELLQRRRSYLIELAGLKQAIEEKSGDSEIMEYFLVNRFLHLQSVRGDYMTFVVDAYLEYFDQELANRVIDNNRSVAWLYSDGYDRDALKALLKEIFVSDHPRLKIRTCAAYGFQLDGRVEGQTDYDLSEFSKSIPNMHIQRHACLGDYRQAFADLMRRRDYITVIEQCVASCKSLNFGDGIVMDEFFECLLKGRRGNNRCIELPDGSVVNAKEAIAWMQAEEEAHGEEKKEEEAHE